MPILLATSLQGRDLTDWAQTLRAALPEETIVTDRGACALEAIDIAIITGPEPGALQGLPALRFIQSTWAGVERLLHDNTLPAHVPLARMVDPAMSEAMAQTALWAVLSLHRGFFDYAQQQAERRWQLHPQTRADECRVAVLGLGEIGRVVAARVAGSGYPVTGWSRRPTSIDGIDTRHGDAALHGVLSQADLLINLLPLTEATRGLFNSERFALMKRGASLVNLGRGGHVIEADLLQALELGLLHRAVLDVFEREPLPIDHPFWQHPRITVLPHAAAMTDPRSAAAVVAANVRSFRAGGAIAHRVDRTQGY